MDRNLYVLADMVQEKQNDLERVPEWQKSERLGYCEPSKQITYGTDKIHSLLKPVRHTVASSLRKVANLVEPVSAA